MALRGLLFGTLCLLSQHAGAVLVAPYFPLPTGATWTYSLSFSDGSPPTAETRTYAGAAAVFPGVQEVVRDQAGNERYFTNDELGLRLHGMRTEYPSGDVVDQYSGPWILLPADATVGMPVQSLGQISIAIEGSSFGTVLNYSATATLVGIETVTVPAGTFTDVLHIRLDVLTQPGAAPETQDIWLAKGIGPVREVRSDWRPGPTRTWELTGYDVPDNFPDPFAFAPKTVDGPGGTLVASEEVTEWTRVFPRGSGSRPTRLSGATSISTASHRTRLALSS
jgi:hypothetical protein